MFVLYPLMLIPKPPPVGMGYGSNWSPVTDGAYCLPVRILPDSHLYAYGSHTPSCVDGVGLEWAGEIADISSVRCKYVYTPAEETTDRPVVVAGRRWGCNTPAGAPSECSSTREGSYRHVRTIDEDSAAARNSSPRSNHPDTTFCGTVDARSESPQARRIEQIYGSLSTYPYRFGPPPKPIGSFVVHRPVCAS